MVKTLEYFDVDGQRIKTLFSPEYSFLWIKLLVPMILIVDSYHEKLSIFFFDIFSICEEDPSTPTHFFYSQT
uniref:Ovule protein n=1 Tax=Caenorhabditis tropicalis TaxID=1561998 RepID=A0A1I7UBR7_9PELO